MMYAASRFLHALDTIIIIFSSILMPEHTSHLLFSDITFSTDISGFSDKATVSFRLSQQPAAAILRII